MNVVRNFLLGIFLLSGSFVLAACSDNGPSSDEVGNAIQGKLPVFIKFKNLSIEATENIGTETEPNFQSRFKGVFEFTQDTYQRVGLLENAAVLRRVVAKGTEKEVFGLSNSVLVQGKWSTKVKYQGRNPLYGIGQPASVFGKHYIDGSEALAKRREEIRQAKIEAEKRRIALLKAKRKSIVGIWEAAKIVTKGQTPIGAANNNLLRYSITFPDGEDFKGIAKVTVFTVPDIEHQLGFDVRFEVSEKGVFWTEARGGKLPLIPHKTAYYTGTSWRSNLQGNDLVASNPRNRWTAKFEKLTTADLEERAANKKKRAAELLEFRHRLAGRWTSDGPLFFKGKPARAGRHDNDPLIFYSVEIPKGDNMKGIAVVTYRSEPNTKGGGKLQVKFEVTRNQITWMEPDERVGRPWFWRTGGEWYAELKGNSMTAFGTQRSRGVTVKLKR